MKIPSLKQQIFGDINKKLNAIRRQMNHDIIEQMLEGNAKKEDDKVNN